MKNRWNHFRSARIFWYFFQLLREPRKIYGLRETHYSGIVKMVDTVFENHRKSLIQHCEQSYGYILSGQKLIKNAKNGSFWRVFENLKLAVKQCYQTDQF